MKKLSFKNINTLHHPSLIRRGTKGTVGGFTLVETLVAVAILVIGTLGPITIAAQGIASAAYAKDQITAYYLAQEGIEYVRNVRDSNAIQSDYWLSHLDSCLAPTGNERGCYISSPDAIEGSAIMDAVSCSSSTGCPTIVSSNDSGTLGLYGYSFGDYTNTTYVRTIRMFPVVGNSSEQLVQVDITWRSRGNARSFTLKENIYDSN